MPVLALLAGSACNSPTLPPLPPPGEPRLIEPAGDGEVLIEGRIPVEEAKLLMLNLNNDQIRGVFTHDGRYSVRLPAVSGDYIHLWYTTSGHDSPVESFEIPEFPESPMDETSAGDAGAR